jgi:hypothetical protein
MVLFFGAKINITPKTLFEYNYYIYRLLFLALPVIFFFYKVNSKLYTKLFKKAQQSA